jgi:protein-disulfide isomerase
MEFKPMLKRLLAGAIIAASLLTPAMAQTGPAPDKAAIEKIVRDYLMANPEILIEMMAELKKRQEMTATESARKAIGQHAKDIFDDPDSPVGGNPKGTVTIVEFFDYHCGYCKQVQGPMQTLLKEDGNIRVVYKELPILRDESRTAALAALASVKQGKYEAFHNALMGTKAVLDKSRIMAIAKTVGLDTAKLEKDMEAPELAAALEKNMELARLLDVSGTPAFVIGNDIIPGAISLDELRKVVAKARKS